MPSALSSREPSPAPLHRQSPQEIPTLPQAWVMPQGPPAFLGGLESDQSAWVRGGGWERVATCWEPLESAGQWGVHDDSAGRVGARVWHHLPAAVALPSPVTLLAPGFQLLSGLINEAIDHCAPWAVATNSAA